MKFCLQVSYKVCSRPQHTPVWVLYHKVPGWPFGFGSNKKAKLYLEKALAINPQGIDSNYFYGEYLYNTKKYQAAKKYLEIARLAPARINRSIADDYRQKEVAVILAKVNKKLK